MKTISSLALLAAALLPARPAAAQDAGAADAPVPKGGRTLGIDVCAPEDNDYGRAFALARQAGMDATQLTVYWDDLEKAPGTFAPEPNYLAISNLFYPAQKTPLHLVIAVIDTVKKRLPRDLADKPLDDPRVIDRFQTLLDYVFSQIPALDVASLSIGNEIDGCLGTQAGGWKEYQAFFAAAKARAKEKRPGLKVGVKLMYAGLVEGGGGHGRKLNEATDVVMVNRYPLNGDFTVKAPAAVESEFDALVAAFPGRPLYFTELGYPAGAACKSSEALQAEFVHRLFRAWDKHAGAIPYVNLCTFTDRPPAFLDQSAKYYGLGSPAFLDFLKTLGLRTYAGSGKDKAAFQALKDETKARGWRALSR